MGGSVSAEAGADSLLQKRRSIRYTFSAVAERTMNNFYLIFCKKRTLVGGQHDAVCRKKIFIQDSKGIQIFHRAHLVFFQSIIHFPCVFVHMSLEKVFRSVARPAVALISAGEQFISARKE